MERKFSQGHVGDFWQSPSFNRPWRCCISAHWLVSFHREQKGTSSTLPTQDRLHNTLCIIWLQGTMCKNWPILIWNRGQHITRKMWSGICTLWFLLDPPVPLCLKLWPNSGAASVWGFIWRLVASRRYNYSLCCFEGSFKCDWQKHPSIPKQRRIHAMDSSFDNLSKESLCDSD